MTKKFPDATDMTGCWIDGSHRSTLEFTALVIELAHDYGFELEWDQFVADIEWMNTPNPDYAVDKANEILEALDWTYEDALEYLNTNTRDGLVWEVVDQSLYLVEVEDD
jgi:hypothetical protein